MLDETITRLEDMIRDFPEISARHYVDVEHLLFKHVGPHRALELEHVHLFGSHSSIGKLEYE